MAALHVVSRSDPSSAADRCAREILETVPLVMRVVRAEMRRVALTLTPAGGRLFARLRSKARRQIAMRLAGASAADLRKVADALAVLDRLFREEARIIG